MFYGNKSEKKVFQFTCLVFTLFSFTIPILPVAYAQSEKKSEFVTKTEASKKTDPAKKSETDSKTKSDTKNEPKAETKAQEQVTSPEPTAEATATFSDWSVHIYGEKDKKVCFIASEPKESKPEGAARSKIVFYISTWPGERVRHEVSVKIGYSFKAKTEPVAEIGSDIFHFFVKDEKAFLENAAEELKLLETMKKGKQLVFKGTSARGTTTTDTFSLAGLSAALASVEKDCAF